MEGELGTNSLVLRRLESFIGKHNKKMRGILGLEFLIRLKMLKEG